MFYGLLLEDSTFAKLNQEALDGKVVTRDDESWLLGLEAWVPCFALARARNGVDVVCNARTYGVSSKP